MEAGYKLFSVINAMGQKANPPSEKVIIQFATVTSVNPIAILVEGCKEPIGEEFIEIGALCRRYVIPQPHIHFDVGPDTPTTSKETEEIELWRGLRAGDRVIVFRFNSGQVYFIYQRVEMEGFRD